MIVSNRIIKILLFLIGIGFPLHNTAGGEFSSPPVLRPAIRLFYLDRNMDISTAEPIPQTYIVEPRKNRYLCAEIPANEILFFFPSADKTGGAYVNLVLEEQGAAWMGASPSGKTRGADAFLRLHGDPKIVCRLFSGDGQGPVRAGIAGHLRGEYVWEEYEEALKDWAFDAAFKGAKRPPHPPVAAPSSLPDRLWFLSEWIYAAGMAGDHKREELSAFLERAAMWEVMRIRPLNPWAFSIRDISDSAGDECGGLEIEDENGNEYCRSAGDFQIKVEGPAILQVRLRPKVKLDPTPALQEFMLNVTRNGAPVFFDPVPIYPDREPYPEDRWVFESDPVLSPHGDWLGRPNSLRFLVPEGVYSYKFSLSGQELWCSLKLAKHRRHMEDALAGEEDFNGSTNDAKGLFGIFLRAEELYRLGLCKGAIALYRNLMTMEGMTPLLIKGFKFRADTCSPGGELLTPGELSEAFALLGKDVPVEKMRWEDRRGQEFRLDQIREAFSKYEHSYPGLNLEPLIRKGEASSAQIHASSQLWHLDSVWTEVEPPDDFLSEQILVFQDRMRYPDKPALPGGISLVRITERPRWSSSKLLEGVPRAITFVASGGRAPFITKLKISGADVTMMDRAPVQVQRVLVDKDVEVKKKGDAGRDVWMQMGLLEDNEVADAKLVRVWEIGDDRPLIFEPPYEGYKGYAMLQVFPPGDSEGGGNISFTVTLDRREQRRLFYSQRAKTKYPITDRENMFVGEPVSFPIFAREINNSIRVDSHGLGGEPWYARLLLRVPRASELDEISKLRGGATDLADGREVEKLVEDVRNASVRLAENASGSAKETAEILLERSHKLCRLGSTGLAREDLLKAGGQPERNEAITEKLLALRALLDAGDCSTRFPEDEKMLHSLSAGLFTSNVEYGEARELSLRFLERLGADDTEGALALCSQLVLRDDAHYGCLPWWTRTAARMIVENAPAPEPFLPMVVAAAAFGKKTEWTGIAKQLKILLDQTNWEPLTAVEVMEGKETCDFEGSEASSEPPGNYSEILRALMAKPGEMTDPWVLFRKSTMAISLPIQEPMTLFAEAECRLLTSVISRTEGACSFALYIDGEEKDRFSVRDGERLRKPYPLSTIGNHLIELHHLGEEIWQTPVALAHFATDKPIEGILAEKSEGVYRLPRVGRATFFRATDEIPVTFNFLGPTILRIDSSAEEGAAESHVSIKDTNNNEAYLPIKALPGRKEIYMPRKEKYTVEIRPADRDSILIRLFYREWSKKTVTLKPVYGASDEKAGQFPIETGAVSPIEDVIFSTEKPKWGAVGIMAGYRRDLREESKTIDPIDSYFLVRGGYRHRIDGADLWLGIHEEARLRMSGYQSSVLDAGLYWITPGPELRFDLRDTVGIQRVQTGMAAGNMLFGSLARRFQAAPDLSLTPEVGGYWKWQGISSWPRDKIPSYADKSVYTNYGDDHPYALAADLTTVYRPFINADFFGAAGLQMNSDFISVDHATVKAGTRMAFERFLCGFSYGLQPRLADEHRRDFYLRHRLHAMARYSWWPVSMLRVAPLGSYDFYPHRVDHAFLLGILFEISPERGLRDSLPGTEPFGWQIDQQRRWVRQW